jgi:hypothetical protein
MLAPEALSEYIDGAGGSMKNFETATKPFSTREDRGYTITSTGNVVVDVDRLLSSEKVKGIAEMAKSIVQRHKRAVE